MKLQKNKIYLLGFICLFLLSSQISNVLAETVFTDTTNDITTVSWVSQLDYSVDVGQSVPKIDIQSVEYGVTGEGNHTVTLNMLGTPVFDNETFYWITVEDDTGDDDMSLIIWAGGFTGYNEDSPATVSYLKGDLALLAVITPEISGNSIIFNIPKQTLQFNISAVGYYELVDLGLPDTVPESWVWDIWTWTGDVLYGTYDGTWSMDYYPNDNNDYDTALPETSTNEESNESKTSTESKEPAGETTPGFELMVLAFSAFIYREKRKK